MLSYNILYHIILYKFDADCCIINELIILSYSYVLMNEVTHSTYIIVNIIQVNYLLSVVYVIVFLK